MKSAEEILNEAMLLKGNPAVRSFVTETEWQSILFAMDKYANQFKPESKCCMTCYNWRYTQNGQGECSKLKQYTTEDFFCKFHSKKTIS